MPRNLSHEEAVERLSIKNPTVSLVGRYINRAIKIKTKCNLCGHQWDANYGDLIKGSGCPICGKKRIGQKQRMTHEEFVAKVNELFDNTIEVLEPYIKSDIKISYKCKVCGNEWNAKPNTVLNGHGCPACSLIRRAEKRTKNHADFIQEITKIHPDIIIHTEHTGSHDRVKCECKKCGNIWWAKPNTLLCGAGCRKCGYIKNGENRVKSHEDFLKEFSSLNHNSDNIEIIGTYHRALEKIKCRCKLCGSVFEVTPSCLLNDWQCQVCSDNSNSYPNRFSYAFLSLLPVKNHIKEYSPEWIGRRRYDNYFEYKDNKYILEMDGGFHYVDAFDKTAEEVQAIDKYKDKMAEQHGIKVIRIECIQTHFNYIKRNIIESSLSEIFDLSNYDWELCNSKIERYSYMSIWEYANKHSSLSVLEIANELNRNENSIRRIIKLGNEKGYCDYKLSQRKLIKKGA